MNPKIFDMDIAHKYSVKLMDFLQKNDVKKFNYSQFSEINYISKGKFARVHSATYKNEIYALKCLNNNLHTDMATVKQLNQEITNLYNVSHPNIVKLYGVSINEETGNFTLVLQLANNGTLRDYLRMKHNEGLYQISWNELVDLAKGITNGLKCLHDRKILHRDLSSKNILIHNGKALIADFGLSKSMDEETSQNSSMQCILAYTDPQYLMHGIKYKLNQESDIYSLGILFWELTSGIPPFYGCSNFNICKKVLANNMPEIVTDTPSGYVALFVKCWSSNPKERPTLNVILSELEKLSEEDFTIITNKVTLQQNHDLSSKSSNDNQSKSTIKMEFTLNQDAIGS